MEMTASYEHLLVLCTASMIALVTAQLLGGQPIYDTLLKRSLQQNCDEIPASERRNVLELTVASGSVVDGNTLAV